MTYNPNWKPETGFGFDATTGRVNNVNFVETFFSSAKHFRYRSANYVRAESGAKFVVNSMMYRVTAAGNPGATIQIQTALSNITPGAENAVLFLSADGQWGGIGIYDSDQAGWFLIDTDWSTQPQAVSATYQQGYYIVLNQVRYPWVEYAANFSLLPVALAGTQTWTVNGTQYSGTAYLYSLNLDVSGTAYRCVPNPYTPNGDCFFIASSTVSFQPVGAAFSVRTGSLIQ